MAAEKKSPKEKSPVKKFARDQQMNARRAIIEEMFNDMYNDRRNIYTMNFFRGIFLGLGTAIGGTLAVALIVWLLSLFVNFPGIGQTAEQAQESLQSTQKK